MVKQLAERRRVPRAPRLLAVHGVERLVHEEAPGIRGHHRGRRRTVSGRGEMPVQAVHHDEVQRADERDEIGRHAHRQALGGPEPPRVEQVVQRRVAARHVLVVLDRLQAAGREVVHVARLASARSAGPPKNKQPSASLLGQPSRPAFCFSASASDVRDSSRMERRKPGRPGGAIECHRIHSLNDSHSGAIESEKTVSRAGPAGAHCTAG